MSALTGGTLNCLIKMSVARVTRHSSNYKRMQLWEFANALADSQKYQFATVPAEASSELSARLLGRVAMLEMVRCDKFMPSAQMASLVVGYNNKTKVA